MCDDWTCMEFVTLDNLPQVAGVYFLMNDCELVYVGQSNNIKSRIKSHHNLWNCTLFLGNKPIGEDTFDSCYYLEVDYKPERKEYEYMFRGDYWPKLNAYDWERDYYIPKKTKEDKERYEKELLELMRKKGQLPLT